MRIACVIILLASARAAAQPPAELPERVLRVSQPAGMESTSAVNWSSRSTRDFVRGQEVIPGERQVGTELALVTSGQGLDGRPLHLTDLVTTRLFGRASLGDRFELGGRVDLLAKQPFPGGQALWNGGALSGRVQVGPHSSICVDGGGQPLVSGRGAAGELSAAWNGRAFIDRRQQHVALVGGGGLQATSLFAAAPSPPRLGELLADVALEIIESGDPDLGIGFEMGAELAQPFWRSGRAFWLDGAPSFDARARVHLYLGFALTFSVRWDLFVRWSTFDRGDAGAPATELPLLRGGRDQSELVFGLTYRFGPNVSERSLAIPL